MRATTTFASPAFLLALVGLVGLVGAVVASAACAQPNNVSAPMTPSAPSAPRGSTDAGSNDAGTQPTGLAQLVGGELTTTGDVSFEVRPLSGPGTMGPWVLSPTSEPALNEVRAYLAAHPDAGPLRIESSVNPMKMSSMPDARWPAGLSLQIARWLVDNGVECGRLEPVGRLDRDSDTPVQRARFFLGGSGRGGGSAQEARLDACSDE